MFKFYCILILCLCLMFSTAAPVSSTDSTTDSSSSSTSTTMTDADTIADTKVETTAPTKVTSQTTSSTKPKPSLTTTTPPDSDKYPWLYPTTASPNGGLSMDGVGILAFVISGFMGFMFIVWIIMKINNGCCMQTPHTSGGESIV